VHVVIRLGVLVTGVREYGAQVRHRKFACNQQRGRAVFTAAHADDVVGRHAGSSPAGVIR
jgi:hypothetical protein